MTLFLIINIDFHKPKKNELAGVSTLQGKIIFSSLDSSHVSLKKKWMDFCLRLLYANTFLLQIGPELCYGNEYHYHMFVCIFVLYSHCKMIIFHLCLFYSKTISLKIMKNLKH